ncbi:protein Jumonji isoform X2 [Neocloeon triangulifer]|uniref:protein Jumonji isoform X2 n=1 Tax=Neocloeon triangulifer TaxID=2078957 RepID=UPI00286F4847|nr:protein Jumonji isoform X2 [Neocloeon triangulifer]
MMVVRNDPNRRRKREGSDTPVATSAQNDDIEKRTKVHAQRKFAQGSSLSSPSLTPVKDKTKANGLVPEPVAEMLPAKRPKTTDFLTFLCLRGSSFLPTRLNFFNTPPAPVNSDQEPIVNGHTTSKAISSKAERAPVDPMVSKKVKEIVKDSKKASTSSTVQALKRKYQEQRLTSKTRSGVLNKLAQKAKDKSLSRTRSGVVIEKKPSPKKIVKTVKVVKTKPVVKAAPAKSQAKDSSGITTELASLVLPVTKRKKSTGRVGLRSGGRVAPKALPMTKRTKSKATPSKVNSRENESESEESDSEEEEEKPEVNKPKAAPKVAKKMPIKKSANEAAKKIFQLAKTAQQKKARLQTRSSAPAASSSEKKSEPKRNSTAPTPRLSRKTKEAATIYMELLGQKWMSPGDEDDEDEESDGISLYSFPELRRQSEDKNSQSPVNKRRKINTDTKQEEEKKDTPVKRLPGRPRNADKPKETKNTCKAVAAKQSPAKKAVEKKKESSPIPMRKTRGSIALETFKSSDSEDETLDKKIKKSEEKKKKEEKELEKQIAKPATYMSKKAKSAAIKAQSMSQLVRFTKKKFLNVRKSTEACIQELVASTLERLNKQEEEEADEIDLDLINEPIIPNKKKEQQAEKMKESAAEKKEVEPKKVDSKQGKELIAKKSASVVPPPAKLLPKSNDKFYAKKSAAIYPPSPAKLKKMTKAVNEKDAEKEPKKIAEIKIAPKPAVTKLAVSKPEDPKVLPNLPPAKAVQITQTGQIAAPNFVMINSTSQDLVLIPSASTSAATSPSKYIVCRKETIVTATGGVQYMMVPTDKVVLPVPQTLTVQPPTPEAKKPVAKKQEPKVTEESKKVKPQSSAQIPAGATTSKKATTQDKGGEKKAIFKGVRAKNVAKSAGAFSPEKEDSVYAFDTDPEEDTPTSPPFRRKKEELSPASSLKQSSIAVQVNFDENASAPVQKSSAQKTKNTVGTESKPVDGSDRLFFIPIQPGVPLNQQIQGVEVKVGTEGPNQRVVMQAKLVTNPSGKFASPMNATGLVRSSQHPAATAGKTTLKAQPKKTGPPAAKTTPKASPSVAPAEKSSSSTASTSKSSPQVTPKVQAQAAKKQPEPTTPVTTTKSAPSTPKPITRKSVPKKVPLQRQSSFGNSSKETKAVRLFEPQPTPAKFPTTGGTDGTVFEAPVFRPTEREFQDPFEYIEKISAQAEQFGICRIVPPSSFKPECKVSDDMRFMAYNQYVHKMVNRWGPNAKETAAIKKLLKKQNVAYTHPPWIGGMEIDLPKFSQTVRSLGGLKGVIMKKRWQKVAEAMKIPKSAQDRVSKLDEIYCQFLLAYDTLSPTEKQELLDEVQKDWDEKQQNDDGSSDEDEDVDDNYDESEECIAKGRNMPLSAFYRIARNTMSMWFKTTEPPATEVEAEYWRITRERTNHVCVHSGSIDSGVWGYGFPTNKNSSCAKHPWNLKVLSNNNGTILRSMGSVMGVTVPTLHVGMLFSTFCWYRDPHGLPWIEYLHTGASKIWYGIPNSHSTSFKNAMTTIVPKYCRDKNIWLSSDTAMVPPEQLISHGVSLCRTVQEPGQFILVFPRAFTSSISTGYLVSESVYFAQPRWLKTAQAVFRELKDSSEPTMFSLERLLFSMAEDNRCSTDVLKMALPLIKATVEREEQHRDTLKLLGLRSSERLPLPESSKKARSNSEEDNEYECEVCRANLYLSLVTNSQEEAVYCLPHAISVLNNKKHQLKNSKLLYTYDLDELKELLLNVEDKIETKGSKKSAGK